MLLHLTMLDLEVDTDPGSVVQIGNRKAGVRVTQSITNN